MNEKKKHRVSRWAFRLLKVMIVVALLGDFIANERPIICKIDGAVYFPVLKQYAVDLGWSEWDARFVSKKWKNQDYDWVVFPPIPYSNNTLDIANGGFKSPFDEQEVSSLHFRHWLGTDNLGRDVFAGMVSGTRTALLVGILAMGVAAIIGILMGLLAGYYGNTEFRTTVLRLVFILLGGVFGVFYGFTSRAYAFEKGGLFVNIGIGLLVFGGIVFLFRLLAILVERVRIFRKEITLPIDAIVLRIIEVLNSIPALLLILSLVALFRKPSLFNIMIIIGLISWTGIARFVRAELMKIRQMEYIEAARALGFSEWRIMWKHALPNALGPVMIALAFGIAGAILVEALLSFIGVGLPPDMVTWGTMLNSTREATYAWWLAIFPGGAIFITVTLFNLLGEHLEKAGDSV